MARSFTELEREALADPERRENIARHEAAMRAALKLARIREQVGATQEDLARALGVTQGRVSKLERADDAYLSTLARYVAALGGRLEVSAVFPDQTVRLTPEEERERVEA